MNILVVEDDSAIRDLIAMNLEISGYNVVTVGEGGGAKKILSKENIDLVLLDVMLPGEDGFSIINDIKELKVPVIFVTAKENVLDRVKGLRLGAEDYIVKPFEAIELLARVEVVLRRYKSEESISFNGIEIYEEQRIVKLNNLAVDITVKEYDLLMLFIRNKNIALSRDQIVERVWGYDYDGDSRTVDIHISRLRDKLKLHDYIKTVYKIGYRFEI